MQISIKPISDWPIYLTASADERLACITQTSFHSTTSFMNPFLATVAQNRIIANSLTYTTGPLTFLFHPGPQMSSNEHLFHCWIKTFAGQMPVMIPSHIVKALKADNFIQNYIDCSQFSSFS